MAFAFVLTAVAAVFGAAAALLQSVGARRLASTRHLDPRLLVRLAFCGPYAAGLALDGASSGLVFAALRSLPLFAVQAVTAASLSLVALLSSLFFRARLRPLDWLAVAAVMVGLVLIVASAKPGPPAPGHHAAGWVLLGVVLLLTAGGSFAVARLKGGAVLGMLAGLAYGSTAAAARILGGAHDVGAIARSPALYALIIGAVVGTLLYARSLQRGAVTSTSAMAVVGQTTGPAIVGYLALGDHVRHGFGAIAVVGFILAVAGAVSLTRHGARLTASTRQPVTEPAAQADAALA